jgi:anti-anti-sigma regulatory factor
MLIVIKDFIKEEDFNSIKTASDKEVTLDLKEIKYLSSKEITKILVLIKEMNKKIELINCNSHIKETIKVLNLNEVIKIRA